MPSWSMPAATATLKIIAGLNVSLSEARLLAAVRSVEKRAALQTIQQSQLSRQLRHNCRRICRSREVSARCAVMSASDVERCVRSEAR